MNKLKLFIAVLVISFAVSACMTFSSPKPVFEPSVSSLFKSTRPVTDEATTRQIGTGKLQGFADSYNTYAWLNIPYATPPVGELRWKAPLAAQSWSGVRSAAEYGEPCTQYWGRLAGVDGEVGDIVGAEDCLNLNVWSPQAASASNAKPVMVWIHGGSNDSGTGKVYQGHHLAGSQDVVVVTINYRVGLLGWLSHPAIRATAQTPEDASGNFGTLDIIAALKWVQSNIAEFGGDANNVTIFGESAGGRNVYSMLASPLAKGLFHKAISQSGSADTTLLTLAEDFADKENGAPISGLINSSNGLIASVLQKQFPQESSEQIRARLKDMAPAALMSELRAMSGSQLMRQASENIESEDSMRMARITRDGYVMPKQSTYALLSNTANYNNVPLMLGTNRDEQKLFLSGNPEYVDYKFGLLPRIKDVERYNRVSKYISENWKAGAVDEPAKRISLNGGQPVYAYRFDWDESPSNWLADLPTLIGAAHGLEISFVFGDFAGGVPVGQLLSKDNAAGRKSLSESMMDYWGEFAHSGSPSKGRSGQQTDWQAWQAAGENIMLLDTPKGGGTRMAEVRTNVADIKARIPNDDILTSQDDKCDAYASLFLHGYMMSDFWDPQEYADLGCADFPAIKYRAG